ncbi:MAG: hypothetical protein ACI9QN_001675, partial [Arcticibacterium sp.]
TIGEDVFVVQLKGNLRYFNFLSFFNRLGRY